VTIPLTKQLEVEGHKRDHAQDEHRKRGGIPAQSTDSTAGNANRVHKHNEEGVPSIGAGEEREIEEEERSGEEPIDVTHPVDVAAWEGIFLV
jgi:hypothetical protein